MTELLIRLFVKDASRVEDPTVRKRYGVLSGIVGIVANLLLCAAKFVLGALSGSVAIRADAVNNLSDAGSSLVTLVGFMVAGKPADKEHPYGHARSEYVAALIIAFFILLVGVELGKESIQKILAPTPVVFNITTMVVLALSILVKLWMSRFTSNVGKRIQSGAMTATTLDSLCDVISTGAILLSTLIGYWKGINIDGYAGLLVAAFVLYAGFGILRDTISPLMGESPSAETVEKLKENLLRYDGIEGLHDIMIHNYGPGRTIASAHAEVRSDADILAIHEIIDKAEREVGHQMNMLLTLHLDPVETDNETQNRTKDIVGEVIAKTAPQVHFHDFRMVHGKSQTNLIFDIVVPPGMKNDEIAALKTAIRERVKEEDKTYRCVIDVDLDYTGRL